MAEIEEINTGDLFCGGGGASTGCDRACAKLGFARRGIAINHWNIAVATMRRNHPNLETFDSRIEEVIPTDMWHGKMHLLWASPSCVHHSRARGGKPRSDQERSLPEHVLPWLTQCDVDNLIVENVPEFIDWGPLTDEGQPDKAKKGLFFNAWLQHIRSLGYNVVYDTLCCADYGDATTRRRFFLMASKKGLPMPEFPDPTYGNHKEGLPQWRAVRECLDLSDRGRSIFGREHPLAENTIRRIMAGMKKYNGMDFIVKLRNHETAGSLDEPLNTISTSGAHHMLCSPILVDHLGKGKAHSLEDPLGTQCTHDRYSLCTPVIIGQQSGSAARPIDEPCMTISTSGAIRVATPVIIDMSRPGMARNDASSVRSVDEPAGTLTTCDAMQLGMPVLKDGRVVDILLRMLKPSELAAVHGFPSDYVIEGNRRDKVKQIGNSVPVMTAAALCEQILKQYAA